MAVRERNERRVSKNGMGSPQDDPFRQRSPLVDQNPHSGRWLRRPVLALQVFQAHSSPSTQTRSCLLDSIEEPWIMLEAVIEPVIFRLETDEYASGLTMARDDDLRLRGFSEVPRQVVLDL
jgi:hypothetical protein